MSDIEPATDEQVEEWRTWALAREDTFCWEDILALIARFEAAEAERDRLAEKAEFWHRRADSYREQREAAHRLYQKVCAEFGSPLS